MKSVGAILGKSGRYLLVTSLRLRRRFGEKKLPQKVSSLFAAGTTSLYKYLMQHPEVLPAEDKELTFWGNFFSPKRRPKREEVMQEYLTKFPKIEPGDFKLTGEATPGYLYCSTCPKLVLKFLPKVKLLLTRPTPKP